MIDGRVAEREHREWDIDMEAWAKPKPFGLSGCFRLRNESEFMVQAVESFLPWLDEAVLVIQPSTDDTLSKAVYLSNKYPVKVRIVPYSFVPTQFNTKEHYELPPNSVRHFVQLSNWALSQCRYSWIAKVEGDVIALSSFAEMRRKIDVEPDLIRYYGMVLLNLAGRKMDRISATNPRNHGWDEAVFNNDPSRFHFVRSDKWEMVTQVGGKNVCMGWMLHHLKRCKEKYQSGFNDEKWVAFNRSNVKKALGLYNHRNRYYAHDDPLGAEVLYEATAFLEAQ